MLTSDEIIAFHDRSVNDWHGGEPVADEIGLLQIVAEEHLRNFKLWHVEDEARRRDVDDTYIAEQKRSIDRLNQERQDHIEKVDEEIIRAWPWVVVEHMPMNTETPGSVIDRLSIAALKIYHMAQEVARTDVDEAHRDKCRGRFEILMRQRRDLAEAFDLLIDDLKNHRKRLQVYRQFKMYNDPATNPALYRKSTS